jgi:glycerol-3-phosphate O-acyltransferase
MTALFALLGVLGTLVVVLIGGVIALLAVNDLRLKLKRWMRRRLTKEQLRIAEQFRLELNPHKLEKKTNVRLRLLSDPVLREDLEAHAKSTGEPLVALLGRVDDYADEIIPFFNIVSYYRVGYVASALAIRALYWPWKDRPGIERVRTFLDGARDRNETVVFLMNHRSNADFVLVGYVLARAIALSYAVGEWARVWPLEWLFKSFGSYFVRRGCKDPVYHLTLRRYLQLITDEGVTQGIFIEGGLSRDGAFRSAKIGLIDSIATRPMRAAPSTTERPQAGEVYFVPVGINYDRVLEDEVLTSEVEGAEGMGKGLAYYFSAMARIGKYFFANLPRYFVRRVRKFGYAAVQFGEPIAMSSLLDLPLEEVRALDREARKPVMQTVADRLLEAIGRAVPVTPVALVTAAILGGVAPDEEAHVTEAELRDRLSRLVEELRRAGAPVVGHERGLAHLEKVGLTILEMRKHVRRVGGVIVTASNRRHLLRYYENGILQHLARVRALPEHGSADELGLLGKMPERDAAAV